MNADWVTRPWAGWRLEWRSAVGRVNFTIFKDRSSSRWSPVRQFAFAVVFYLLLRYHRGEAISWSLLMAEVPGILLGLVIARILMILLPAAVLLLRRARRRARPVAFS